MLEIRVDLHLVYTIFPIYVNSHVGSSSLMYAVRNNGLDYIKVITAQLMK
jgi:hypothetical protein